MVRLAWLAVLYAVACSQPAHAPPRDPPSPPMSMTARSSPFDNIGLRVDMPREQAETAIAKALGTTSGYSPYGNNLRGGTVTYKDATGAFLLEVVYKAGIPAPWVVGADGVAEHYPPIDESITSFRTFQPPP